MKKRVLSLLMALVLCFSLLPTAALAEDADAAQEIQTAAGDVENTGDIEDTGNIDDTEAPDDKAQDAGDSSAPDAGVPDGETDTTAPVTLAEPEENVPAALANDADKPQGEGTAEAPYLIGTLAELQWFRDTVNGGTANICAKLTADIKWDSDKWVPIGTETAPYIGTFDGNGCQISISYATAPADMEKGWGLFGYIGDNGKVQDLNIYTRNFGWNYGPFSASESGMLAAYNAGTIERCTAMISQIYVTCAVGLLVYQNNGTIQDCLTKISDKISNGAEYIGGIVYQNSGSIRTCFFNGGYQNGSLNNHTIASENTSGSIDKCYFISGRNYWDDTSGVASVSDTDIYKLTVMLNNDGDATGSETDPWRFAWSTNLSLKKTDSRVRYENGQYVIEKPHMHSDEEFKIVAALSDITEGGNYCISDNVALSETWTVSGDVKLCLNGKSITADSGITAIKIENGASLTLVDCSNDKTGKITGGEIGVMVGGGFAMQGGEISGCGTGVSVQGGTLTLSGSAKVSENTNQNILLAAGQTISFGTLNADAKFGISVAGQDSLTSPVAVTDETGGQYHGQLAADGFNEDGSGFELYPNEDGTVSLGRQSVHTHCICGTNYTNTGHTAHSDVTFKPWTATGSLPQEGNYYLTRNVTLTSDPTLKSANICLNGYTVTLSGSATRIRAGANGTDNCWGSLTDCTGKGTVTGGGVYIWYNGTFSLYGGTLRGTHVEISQTGGGTFNLYSGKITGNQTTVAAVDGQNSNKITINMYGGEISGNRNTSENEDEGGGGVYVGQGNQFHMYGGTIKNNSAKNGGGVRIAAAGTTYGSGTFTMSGGEISGNTASGKGGGVYVGGWINVSGSVEIYNNTVNGNPNNVYLPGGKTITIMGELLGTHPIGVTTGATPADGKPVKIAAGGSGYTINEADKDRFTPDAGNVYQSVYSNGAISLRVPPHEHPVNGGTTVTWTPIDSESALRAITAVTENSCYYYLTQDITLNGSSWAPVNGMVLDLNGKSITANGEFDTITVGAGVSFTLTDCKGGGENYGAITHEVDPSTKPLNSKYNGRGVTVSKGGEFTMYGGSIGGNQSSDGGAGVYVTEGAVFTMLGGVISDNRVSAAVRNNGGGLWTAGTTTIGGDAEITGNSALAGGGVYVSGGTLTLQGSAAVTGNTANNTHGSGIFVGTNGRLCVSGSVQVTGNTFNAIIGNVYLDGGYDSIQPILVKDTLTESASIGVSVPNGVLTDISTNGSLIIAKTDAESETDTAGWIKSSSFTVDGWTTYTVNVTDNGKTANLGPHEHQWKYTVSPDGRSISAACANTSCNADGGTVTISVDEDSYTYDGSKRPATLEGSFNTGAATPTVTYTLLKDREYIALPDGEAVPTNAGQYKASITVGDETAEVTYSINQATPKASDFVVTLPTDLTYDGNDKTAEVKVRDGIVGMGDYTVQYFDYPKSQYGWGMANNTIDVGTYVVRIEVQGTGNYAYTTERLMDEVNWQFTISRSTDYTVHTPDSWENEIEVIEGSEIGDTILTITKHGADTVTVTGVKDESLAGTVTWYTDEAFTELVDHSTNTKFEGVGSTVKLYWKFVFNNDDPQNQNYVTKDETGSVTFSIVAGAQQGLVFKDAGGAVVTAGTKNYGNNSFTLRTENKSDLLNQVSIAYASSNPTVATVTDNGDRSITVTICGVGTTTITATAARVDGKYAQTTATYTLTVEKGVWGEAVAVAMLSYTYNSTPSTPSLWNYNADENVVTYYYSTTNTNSGGTKWENIGPTTLQPGTYYMYAEIAETANYKAYTTATRIFTVRKAYPICSAPTGLTATYGQTLNDITLTNPTGNTPGTWRWENGTQSVDDASTTPKTFTAIFTPTDEEHYKIQTLDVEVTVNPAAGGSLGTVELKLPYADTAEHTYAPDWSGLPKGQTWNYACEYSVSTGSNAVPSKKDMDGQGKLTYAISNGKAGDVITFTLKAQCNNYNDFTVTVKVTIEKAKPTGTPGYTKITSGGQTLADAKLTLTGSDITVPGTVQWVADDGVTPLGDTTKVEANKSYKWLFTPTDTDNYDTLTGKIELYHRSGGYYYPPADTGTGKAQSASTGDAGLLPYAVTALISYTGTAALLRRRKRED